MRFVREVVNSNLRTGLSLLESAPQVARQRVVQSLVQMLVPLDCLLLQEGTAEALLSLVRIVAKSVVETPYGQPLRFSSPLIITVGSSTSCPFPCANCYANSVSAEVRPARHADVALFQRIADCGTPFVMIGGGEPLATPNISRLIAPLLDAGKIVYLSTNASVTPIVDQIARHSKQLLVFLPVWGPKEEHDRQRGRGSFERLQRNLAKLEAVGAEANLLVVLGSDDLSVFDTVAALAAKWKVRSALVTRKLFVGRTQGAAFQPTPQLTKKIIERINSIQPYVRQISVDIPELAAAQERRRSPRMQTLLGIPDQTECSAGNWTMHIDPAGVSYPCFSLETSKEIGIGADLPIADQWKKVVELRKSLVAPGVCLGESGIGLGG